MLPATSGSPMSEPPRVIVPDRTFEPGDRHSVGEGVRHHLLHVLRLRSGDEVVVVDRDGRAFRAVLAGRRGDWSLSIVGPHAGKRVARELVRIRLVLALLKSNRTEWAIQKATEVGVGEVHVVVCDRSVPAPGPNEAQRRLMRLRRVAAEATRQCQRATTPQVHWHRDLLSALDTLSGQDASLGAVGGRFYLDESPGVPPLAGLIGRGTPPDICLAVGPEGAFSSTERQALLRAGFEPAGLGPRVLRAETAAVVAVTVVQVMMGDLCGGPHSVHHSRNRRIS